MTSIEKSVIIPSIMDKLIEHLPTGNSESCLQGLQTVAQYKESIRRDLENLLNSRPSFSLWSASWQELKSSLINYGISDFTSKSRLSEQEALRLQIETAIRNFEPRLLNPRVRLLKSEQASSRSWVFEIEATLLATGVQESLLFHSRLGLSTGTFFIEDDIL
ncbi:MAG: type secretion system lysozyme-related protein [Gammaproteobacteria bacterium]|jgi:type VI secretion system protein ImpF|nr:type secretion system lysozyme-related protein [Gammaproteobacteria bacterium]